MLSKVLPEDWDAPEHLSLSERDFLVTRAEAIHGIVAKSYLDVGRVLLQVKRKFKRDPEMNGWFKRWCDEVLPFAYDKAVRICTVTEMVEDDPNVAALTETVNFTTAYRILCLPTEARACFIEQILAGESTTKRDVDLIHQLPEVELEKAQEAVDQIQAILLRLQLTGKEKSSTAYAAKTRLAKALQQLQEAEEKVASLGKSQTTQEAILAQLKHQLKQQEVQIEEINLDPEQKRKRSLAKTVVDATTSLDLLLSSLDRYGTDKPELGAQAIATIERKMAQVKERLLEHYGSTTM